MWSDLHPNLIICKVLRNYADLVLGLFLPIGKIKLFVPYPWWLVGERVPDAADILLHEIQVAWEMHGLLQMPLLLVLWLLTRCLVLLVRKLCYLSRVCYIQEFPTSIFIIRPDFGGIRNFFLSFQKILPVPFCFTHYRVKCVSSFFELFSIRCNFLPQSFFFRPGLASCFDSFIPPSLGIRCNSHELTTFIENLSKCTFYPLNFLIQILFAALVS